MPIFWLLDRSGNDLGKFQTSAHVWLGGERITDVDGNRLLVIESTPTAYAADFDGYLTVELIEEVSSGSSNEEVSADVVSGRREVQVPEAATAKVDPIA